MRTFTMTTEVDIDLDDYVDEFLEEADDDELRQELEKRGFIVLGKIQSYKPTERQIEFNNDIELKRCLCDIVNTGYYISNEELLESIKQKLP